MKLQSSSPSVWLAAAAAVAGGAILGALFLEHAGGYLPCKLCLEQRHPYYVGLVVIAMGLVWARVKSQRSRFYTVLFAIAGTAVFAKSVFLGVQHAGVEWKWWEGPGDCGMAVLSRAYDAASLLEQIQQTRVVSCSEPALRILGLSLAGWNGIVSLATSALCLRAAFAARHLPTGQVDLSNESLRKD